MFSFVAWTAAVLLQGDAPPAKPQDAPPAAPPVAPPSAAPQDNPAAPDKPATPQEKPTPSQALEELLRRLSTERGAPSVVPPNPLAPPTPEGATKPANAAPELPHLIRAADSVEIALASGERRELAYWDARLDLHVSDEVRQGPHACTLVDFPDTARFRVDGPAVWRLPSDPMADPRRIEFSRLGRTAEFHFGQATVDTVLTLPGGNEVAGHQANVIVHDFDQRAVEIRNSGPEPIVARSPYLGDRVITLQMGQRVFLPVLPEPSAFVSHLTHDASLFDDFRGRLFAQAPDEIALAPTAASIVLSGRGRSAGIARVCGARMVLQPGETMELTRAPLGFRRLRETEE